MNIISIMKNFTIVCIIFLFALDSIAAVNEEPRLHKYSTTVEKERPKLNKETMQLISVYRRNPTEANREALKKQVEINYDKVVARKKAKLEELKKTAKHDFKVREMQEIVDEMIANRSLRVEQTMSRFTDTRLRPGIREAKDGWLPVLGASKNIYIKYTPVTNAEYVAFLKATGKSVAENMTAEKSKHPVTNVSYHDAMAYCKWLSENDPSANYRLPTEAEWQLAAGHMPKDADFNCGEKNGTTPVDAYDKTLSACGAIDMWGNCWEWTSTPFFHGQNDDGKSLIVKGGAYNSSRTNCRTEYKGESRDISKKYDNVGFRVVKEISGTKFSFEKFTCGEINIPYRKAYIGSGEGLPVLIVYLHGGPSRGNDNMLQMREKAVKIISDYLEKNGIYSVMLVPHCPDSSTWNPEMNKVLKELIEKYVDNTQVDARRIYLFGGSMGGTGAWLMASDYPNLFAAVMAVAGSPEGADSKNVARTSVCAVMGENDSLMSASRADNFVNKLKDDGGKVLFCIEEGWGHVKTCEDSYTPERLRWVLEQSRQL